MQKNVEAFAGEQKIAAKELTSFDDLSNTIIGILAQPTIIHKTGRLMMNMFADKRFDQPVRQVLTIEDPTQQLRRITLNPGERQRLLAKATIGTIPVEEGDYLVIPDIRKIKQKTDEYQKVSDAISSILTLEFPQDVTTEKIEKIITSSQTLAVKNRGEIEEKNLPVEVTSTSAFLKEGESKGLEEKGPAALIAAVCTSEKVHLVELLMKQEDMFTIPTLMVDVYTTPKIDTLTQGDVSTFIESLCDSPLPLLERMPENATITYKKTAVMEPLIAFTKKELHPLTRRSDLSDFSTTWEQIIHFVRILKKLDGEESLSTADINSLSFPNTPKILQDLQRSIFIRERPSDKKYSITPKGQSFLKLFPTIYTFIQSLDPAHLQPPNN